jgi:hypothetical protein
MQLTIVTASSSVSLLVDAMSGDATAKTVLVAAEQLLRRIERRSRNRPLPCLTCDSNTLWREEPPGAVAVLMSFGLKPIRTAIGVAVCADCVADRSGLELGMAAVAMFRSTLMPDLRVIPAPSAAGHA